MEYKMQKAELKIELWDILFTGTMIVTILSLDVMRIREIMQIAFIAISVWNMRLKWDMVYGFLISRLLFLLWCALSFMWAFYPVIVIRYIIAVVQSTILAVALIVYLTSSMKRLEYAFFVFGCCSFLLIVYMLRTTSFMQMLQANLTTAQRITAGNINPNQVGICCSYSLLILYWKIDQIRNRPLLHLIGCLLMMVFGLFSLITGSKKALLTIVVGIVFLVVLKSKDAYRVVLRIIFALIFILIILWLIFHVSFLYETIGQRFQGLINYFTNGSADKSTYSRGAMIHQARQVFIEHPFLGIGLHNFKEINFYGLYAHNNYWELLVCLGIPGFLFYYVPIIFAMRSIVCGILQNKKMYALAFVLMLCFLINEYATVSYTNEVIQIVLAMICSMTIITNRQVIGNEQ